MTLDIEGSGSGYLLEQDILIFDLFYCIYKNEGARLIGFLCTDGSPACDLMLVIKVSQVI